MHIHKRREFIRIVRQYLDLLDAKVTEEIRHLPAAWESDKQVTQEVIAFVNDIMGLEKDAFTEGK